MLYDYGKLVVDMKANPDIANPGLSSKAYSVYI